MYPVETTLTTYSVLSQGKPSRQCPSRVEPTLKMPTATRASQFSLTNWGALTTTFTPSADCASSTGIVRVGRPDRAGASLVNVNCDVPTVGSCFPSGSKVDERLLTAYNDPGNFVIGYFSPGIACPAGWSTAGVVVKSSDGSVSTSGVFEAPAALTATSSVRDRGIGAFFNPIVNVFTAAIDPGETGVVCCPRSVAALAASYHRTRC